MNNTVPLNRTIEQIESGHSEWSLLLNELLDLFT